MMSSWKNLTIDGVVLTPPVAVTTYILDGWWFWAVSLSWIFYSIVDQEISKRRKRKMVE